MSRKKKKSTNAKHKHTIFKFSRRDNIGTAGAEDDKKFLSTCYVDTGDLKVLRDCSDPRRIVVGRTGVGKTALLNRLVEVEKHTIFLQPESLSLDYISNSTILKFFMQLGVRLDIFFKLLWKHVLTVELLKYIYDRTTEEKGTAIGDWFRRRFKKRKHLRLLDYIDEYGDSFWQETEHKINEITTNLEEDLEATIKAGIKPVLDVSAGGLKKISKEQKEEVIQRAQIVVSKVQVKRLTDMMALLPEVLTDRQKPHFIIIDRLDEDWVEQSLRYRLIKALVDTAREFRKINNAKVIVAIRTDLLGRVFRLCRDEGFQEEKIRSLYLPIEWTKNRLEEVLDSRVRHLIKLKTPENEMSYRQVFPRSIKGLSSIDYLHQRTLNRPRDIITFTNECIAQAVESSKINSDMVRKAESKYSRIQLKAIGDEWAGDFPNLLDFTKILRNRSSSFRISEIEKSEIEELCLNYCTKLDEFGEPKKADLLHSGAHSVVRCDMDVKDFKKILFQIFYRVGIVGLKLETFHRATWSTSGGEEISTAEISEDSRVVVHPAFHRVFGINGRNK